MSSPQQPMRVTLPFELIILILETTVTISPRAAPTIAIVSRDIKPWIDSVLYGAIILRDWHQASLLYETIEARTSTDPTFFSRTVRVLSLPNTINDSAMVASIINACSGISSLTIPLSYATSTHNIPEMLPSFRCLRNLCISFLESQAPFDGLVSMFPPTLERIIVDGFVQPMRPTFWASLSRIPIVTHILLRLWVISPTELVEKADSLRDILRGFMPDSALRIFAVTIATIHNPFLDFPVSELEVFKEIDDQRLVAFLMDDPYSPFNPDSCPLPLKSFVGFLAMSRWDSRNNPDEDFWVTAEKVISLRQRKLGKVARNDEQ
ncbi:hypothetical protein CYLTODRAFT_488271 [Cylindrobasidium torrendii FP15055 ss-10]|uniref:F-box domain-containing protein n=1 Tax=Cylindrobasidium torrendii FP15055 ss-10 TaxID=1314674 RepID=A0A0D7BI65_9AGAR|nr:hypothetical protein CYLTODRAFT_488271 [Cylindrobasidium torrendii FP15055 ss-10]